MTAFPSIARDGRAYAARMALFYAALFLIYGVHLPYLPVWLQWRGLSPSEIGAIMSAPFFLRLVATPAAAYLADRTESHRTIVIALAAGCAVLGLMLGAMEEFWPIFLVAVAFHIGSSTMMPLTETVAVRGVKAANLDYGRMRLWGSLSFIAAGLAGGWLMDWAGPRAAVWLLAIGAIATLAASFLLPRPQTLPPGGTGGVRHGATADDAIRLVRSPLFAAFLIAVGLIQAAHGTFYAFGAVHWQSQGISTAWIGSLWAVSIVAEVVLFAKSRSFSDWLGPLDLILAGAVAAVVRWAAMTLDPSLAFLVPLQILHALSYGASHLGAMLFLARAVPEGASGTAQALYATFAAGVFMGVVTLASGPLYEWVKGGVYFLPAAIALIGAGLSLWVRRRWAGGPLWT